MTTPNSQDKNATDLKGKKGLRRLINATGYSIALSLSIYADLNMQACSVCIFSIGTAHCICIL